MNNKNMHYKLVQIAIVMHAFLFLLSGCEKDDYVCINVVEKNDKAFRELYVKDIKDQETRIFQYNAYYNPDTQLNIFNFAERGDTLKFIIPREYYDGFYQEYTQSINPNGETSDDVYRTYKMVVPIDVIICADINQRIEKYINSEKDKRRQEEIQIHTTDSLRSVIANMSPVQRKKCESDIMARGTELQKKGLNIIKKAEYDKHIADSLARIKHTQASRQKKIGNDKSVVR